MVRLNESALVIQIISDHLPAILIPRPFYFLELVGIDPCLERFLVLFVDGVCFLHVFYWD